VSGIQTIQRNWDDYFLSPLPPLESSIFLRQRFHLYVYSFTLKYFFDFLDPWFGWSWVQPFSWGPYNCPVSLVRTDVSHRQVSISQTFYDKLFVTKVFYTAFLHSQFFVERILTKKLLVKCYCNWLQVSISPTFYEQFFVTKVFYAAFLYSQFGFAIFCWKKFGVEAVCKMLLKLTAGVNFTNILWAAFLNESVFWSFFFLRFGYAIFSNEYCRKSCL